MTFKIFYRIPADAQLCVHCAALFSVVLKKLNGDYRYNEAESYAQAKFQIFQHAKNRSSSLLDSSQYMHL